MEISIHNIKEIKLEKIKRLETDEDKKKFCVRHLKIIDMKNNVVELTLFSDRNVREDLILIGDKQTPSCANPVFLSDLSEDKQIDSFAGKGTEDLKKVAFKKGTDVVVGHYLKKFYLRD